MTEVENQVSRSLVRGEHSHLVARILARDVRAFEELYHLFRPRLSRFLTMMVKRPSLVEEVLNDTMMVVWDKLEGFRGDSSLTTWIFAIAYRKGMRALKRSDEPVDASDSIDVASPDADPEETAGTRRKSEQLARALGKLSPDHRAVVDLTYFHDLGYREIAEIMSCPVDTVKTRMFHARRHLRGLLDGERTDWL